MNDPFTIAGPSLYVPAFWAVSCAELVDKVIDRLTIEPLTAFAALLEIEEGQAGPLEKGATARRHVVERETGFVLGEQALEPAFLVVTGEAGRRLDPVDVNMGRVRRSRLTGSRSESPGKGRTKTRSVTSNG